MIRICFVCLGNICRSPTAHGIMDALVTEAGLDHAIEIDSAGTGAYHAGERADSRSRSVARRRGVELTSIARQFEPGDFERFDYVIAMDTSNRDNLAALAPGSSAGERIYLMRDFDPKGPRGASVPDPYYGGATGFDDVFDICEAACRGLLSHLRSHHELSASGPGR